MATQRARIMLQHACGTLDKHLHSLDDALSSRTSVGSIPASLYIGLDRCRCRCTGICDCPATATAAQAEVCVQGRPARGPASLSRCVRNNVVFGSSCQMYCSWRQLSAARVLNTRLAIYHVFQPAHVVRLRDCLPKLSANHCDASHATDCTVCLDLT